MQIERKGKTVTIIVVVLIIAIVSWFIAPTMREAKTYSATMKSLNKKEQQALALTASSATLSAVVAAVPGDSTTPIADKIADVSGYCALVLLCVTMEKYILLIFGYVTFRWVIPIAAILGTAAVWLNKKKIVDFLVKLVIFCVVVMCIIPVSTSVSDMIENTNESIRKEELESSSQDQEKSFGFISVPEPDVIKSESVNYGKELSNIVKEADSKSNKKNSKEEIDYFSEIMNFPQIIKDKITELFQDVKNGVEREVTGLMERISTKVQVFLEYVVVMIVTTCLIPIIVMFCMLGLLKAFFNIDLTSKLQEVPGKFGSGVKKIRRKNDKSEE